MHRVSNQLLEFHPEVRAAGQGSADIQRKHVIWKTDQNKQTVGIQATQGDKKSQTL